MPDRTHSSDWTIRISLLILGVLSIFAYINTNDLIRSNGMVTHTHNVINSLELAQNVIVDAESSQRGFILTNNETYLKPYNDSLERLNPTLDYIGNLTSDNDSQQKRLYSLRVLVNKKMTELHDTIQLRRDGKFDDAIKLINGNIGMQYMREIRTTINAMKDEEHSLLEFRLKTSSSVAEKSAWLFPLLIVLDVIISNLTLTLLKRERYKNLNKG